MNQQEAADEAYAAAWLQAASSANPQGRLSPQSDMLSVIQLLSRLGGQQQQQEGAGAQAELDRGISGLHRAPAAHSAFHAFENQQGAQDGAVSQQDDPANKHLEAVSFWIQVRALRQRNAIFCAMRTPAAVALQL